MNGQPPPLAWARSRRIALREIGPGDRDTIVEMHRDARMREHLGVDDFPLDDPRVADVFVERIAPFYRAHEGLGIWHATLIGPNPHFAGWFNLMPMTDRPGQVEIGSRLLPSAWGSGLAIEGCEMLLAHAFDDLGLDTVWGVCQATNRSAAVVLHALGFQALGAQPYCGHPADHFRIDLNSWRVARNTPSGTRIRRALRARASPIVVEEQTA